jgi:hypothetical protein
MRTLTSTGRVPRPAGLADDELRHDLLATWDPHTPDAVAGWLCRPAVLRRVADRMAALIPGDVDRLLGTGPGAAPLAAAVGLATGLPYAALTAEGLLGELHAGETVTVVAADDRPAPAGVDPAAVRVVVLGTPAQGVRPVLERGAA